MDGYTQQCLRVANYVRLADSLVLEIFNSAVYEISVEQLATTVALLHAALYRQYIYNIRYGGSVDSIIIQTRLGKEKVTPFFLESINNRIQTEY